MARIRTIKPEFWSDYKLAAELTREQRLFYIALWNEADDEGRFLAHPRRLLGIVFPFETDISESFIEDSLRVLAETQRVLLYDVGGTPYGELTKFTEHQKINRPSSSRIPAPNNDLRSAHQQLTERSLSVQRQEVGSRKSEVGSISHARDEVFGGLDPLAVSSIKGLYGWPPENREGTDERVWNGTTADQRVRCMAIAVARLEGEAGKYHGKLFRKILETVVAEQAHGGNSNKGRKGFFATDEDYLPGGKWYVPPKAPPPGA